MVNAAIGRRRDTPWRKLWGRKRTRLCLLVIAVYALVSAWGECAYRYYRWHDQTPPYRVPSLEQRYQPPGFVRVISGERIAGGGVVRELFTHPMGTDNLGRDVFALLLQGARIAFHVGIMTSLIGIPL